VQTKKIKGKSYVTFHPNTIVYAIPAGTEMAKTIKASKIGIVWHTSYVGKTFETMKAQYNFNASSLKKSKNVWSQDALLRDLTKFTMSAKDTEEVNGYLSEAGKIFNSIASTTLKQLEANSDLNKTIETFNNSYVRRGEIIMDTNAHVEKLIRFIRQRFQKEIDKKKTDAGRATQRGKMNDLLKFFSKENKVNLKKIFDLQKLLVLAKLKLINILDKLNSSKTFLKTRRGYRLTGQEGYVAVDKLGGDAVKIVDRMEFSFANFSPTILKGWDKPGRN
jgi:hypothetical protein